MGGGTSQMINSVQRTKNQLVQLSYNKCSNEFLNGISDVDIKILDSYIRGNLKVGVSQVTYNTSCIIKNMLDSDISNKQKLNNKSIFTEGLFGGLLKAIFGVKNNQGTTTYQDISNSVTQVISSICQNKSVNKAKNLNITIQNTILIGDITVGSEQKNENIECVIDNYARSKINNDQDSKTVLRDESLFSLLINIAIISAIVFLLVVVVRGIFSIGKKIKDKKSETATPAAETATPAAETATPAAETATPAAVTATPAAVTATPATASPLKPKSISKPTKYVSPKQTYKHFNPVSLGLKYFANRNVLHHLFNANIK